ncbi:hypothetical protein [Mesorhizobium sp. M0847]|uniref:hypothetical protein n=1 Tax=unclassified Mesorhizobium TaxID=325217 RepID=UPI00333B260C
MNALSQPPDARPPGAWGNWDGRPSSYPRHRAVALQLAQQGATLDELSAELKLTIRTLSRWRLSYPDFANALDRGRAKRAIGQDARSLHRNAVAEAERAAALERDRAERVAREARIAEGAAALKEMMKDVVLLPATVTAAAPADARSRFAERRAARGRPPAEHEEPLGWQEETGGDGEALPMGDPRADW